MLAGGFVWFCLATSGLASTSGYDVAVAAAENGRGATAEIRRMRQKRIRERNRASDGFERTRPNLESALEDEESYGGDKDTGTEG